MTKQIHFCGTSLDDLREFPDEARQDAGYQLDRVQNGLDPTDWKPMKTVGPGVIEIRIKEVSGAFRVFYVANRDDKVYVLHAFRKTTQRTEKRDIELARARLKDIG
ncbi:hypothetical protein B6S59_19340 [Pseudomonas sp. A46]|nr:type II toxin-antitoxin system RelE/ParE family toxin [Pseudomonas sp. A46]OWJ92722.1 hypothetical protein B6S59_19340 [Pseudomonas sp. A46]